MAKATGSSVLEGKPRKAVNKNEARRVRRGGQVPAVLYGAGKATASLSVEPREVLRILNSETGHNTIFDLTLDGEKTRAMIVDWQYEPIKGSLLHVDFKRIAMDKVLRVKVPILLRGESVGVKQHGGILEQILREVEIECLPADIPSHVDYDVTELTFGKVVRVSDLPHNEKLKFLSEANSMVAHVVSVKEEVVATPEATAEAAAAAPAEPEVIKKGKQEVEEEGAEAAPAEKSEKKEKEKK